MYSDRNEGVNRARVQAENLKKRKMDNLMKDIQAYNLIQGKHLAKRLKELSFLLRQSDENSEYVSVELKGLSEQLLKLAK